MNPSPDWVLRHEQSQELIPWLVNGRLDDAEAARVESHLEECAQCRAEVESERRILHLVQRNPRVEYAPQASLQKLWARIEEMERDVPTRRLPPPSQAAGPRPPARLLRWTLAAGLACALGLGILVTAGLWPRPPLGNAPYRTATSERQAIGREAQIKVVFSPAVTMDELARIASANRLSIVEGPSDAGVFGLSVTPGSDLTVVEALERLRADPRVRFAEPVHPAPIDGP